MAKNAENCANSHAMHVDNAAEAFDFLAHIDAFEQRLKAAMGELESASELRTELQWLNQALLMTQSANTTQKASVQQCLYLPELASAREAAAEERQNQWVDVLEKLQAGITYHAGSRAPILETLFPKQKLPSLRKATPEGVRSYRDELLKRLKGSYVQRMLATDDFQFAHAILDSEAMTFNEWQNLLEGAAPSVEEAQTLRELLVATANELFVAFRQAQLLSEAALMPIEGAFERHSLGARVKKRALRLIESPLAEVAE